MSHGLFKSNELALMTDIAAGHLIVVPMRRSIERARYLIEYVGIIRGQVLHTGDSIQLITALDVSAAMRQATTFVTCDRPLSKTIRHVGDFRPHLDSLYLAP